ncbi:MAG: NADH-quinone oxidoreductase subunit L [Actinomycetota bacterium]|nr:NADH-quinone oxidoreductase subunit L [Actinomycetota bacterium]
MTTGLEPALALAWLIPVVPALSAGLLLVFGKRLGRLAAPIAITAMGFAATASTLVFAALLARPEGERVVVQTLAPWIYAGPLRVDWAMLLDPLSSVMLLLVTWVGLLIHVYSVGYMHGDERYPRFFAYLNLFAASMLVLVTGSSLLTLFVGWELVGLCSYLLVGFWFERRAYATAAKKAFIVNRIADVGFIVAMFVAFAAFGALEFATILPAAGTVAGATLVAIVLLLFVAATGKSAQIPLYVWLPDAMAGPTPVSALIHAATMVTAGVYLLARTSPLWAQVPQWGLLVAGVGVATALVAAIIACAQNDLKKILAYSTVSQLGYMFVAVGVGDQVAGVFHLLTHGFFKALLFLAAGSVMHAMADETDVWKMGGLARAMPVTFATSLVGVLAIAGFPFTSGFYSKEEILAAAAATPGAQVIWVVGTVVAGLTAFYMTRWLVLIFLGRPRWTLTTTGGAAQEMVHVTPHESPLSMTLPLVVLAVAAAVGGVINLDPETGFLHGWLEPSVQRYAGETPFLAEGLAVTFVVVTGVVGAALAALLYGRRWTRPAPSRGLSGAAQRRFWVDELYEATVMRPGRMLANGFAAFDRYGVDGAVNGSAWATTGLAGLTRRLQTGLLRSYALAVLAGAVVVTVLFLVPVVAR